MLIFNHVIFLQNNFDLLGPCTHTSSFLSLLLQSDCQNVNISDLQHDRFPAKNNDISHYIAYATCCISYIYCIRLNTKSHLSWVYCHLFRSCKVVHYRISNYAYLFEITISIPKRMGGFCSTY